MADRVSGWLRLAAAAASLGLAMPASAAQQAQPAPAAAPAPAAPAPAPSAPAPPVQAPSAANRPELVAGIPVNYDEGAIPPYVLPDPLVLEDGTAVQDAPTWTARRRPEIVRLFEENQHGKAPGRPAGMVFEVHEQGPALGGRALRKQVRIYFNEDRKGPVLNLLSYTPAGATGPVPLLLNISFTANATTVDDPDVAPGLIWSPEQRKRVPAPANAPPFGRVDPVPLLEEGIGFATFYYGDLDPDDHGAMAEGVRQLYLEPGQVYRRPDEWGALGAWAWGISRAIDYFETDPAVDAGRVAITGMSRLGKTALWAGAKDERVAAVIASVSGEGGAAISRRLFGETIAHYVAPSRYPYQFAANYARYAAEPASAPMDGNLLVALIAPRPLLLQTGSTDFWSDPKGEFLSAIDASRVYELLGDEGLGTDIWPEPGRKVGGTLSYYMHEGGHVPVPGDWPVFIDFLKTHLKP